MKAGYLGSKGLIELEKVNVIDLQASRLDSCRDCNRGPNPHDGRVHSDGGKASEGAHDGEAALECLSPCHQQHCRGAIADLSQGSLFAWKSFQQVRTLLHPRLAQKATYSSQAEH